jgi:hypothetical protein
MIRYRIARGPQGRHIVLPAWVCTVPISETYTSRRTAQETADWLNGLSPPEEQASEDLGAGLSVP